MSDIATIDAKINDMIIKGQAMEAFEEFYTDDCIMQENSSPPTVGKEANRQREIEFFDSVAEFHGAEVRSTGVGDNVTLSEWLLDVTFKNGGRKKLEQVAVRRWRDGKIASERFYYDPS